jgi:hypothetical protein
MLYIINLFANLFEIILAYANNFVLLFLAYANKVYYCVRI